MGHHGSWQPSVAVAGAEAGGLPETCQQEGERAQREWKEESSSKGRAKDKTGRQHLRRRKPSNEGKETEANRGNEKKEGRMDRK